MPNWIGVAPQILNVTANQTANRAIGTAYQNTTQLPMIVYVNFTGNSTSTTFSVQMGASNSSFTANGSSGAAVGAYTAIIGQVPASNVAQTQFAVPAGWWYQVNANLVTSSLCWWEQTGQ